MRRTAKNIPITQHFKGEPMITYDIMSLDVWAGEEEGTFEKNNWITVGQFETVKELATAFYNKVESEMIRQLELEEREREDNE